MTLLYCVAWVAVVTVSALWMMSHHAHWTLEAQHEKHRRTAKPNQQAEGAAGGCLKCIAMQYDPAKFSPAERPAEADGTLGRGHLDSYSSPARAAAGVLPPTHSDPDRRASSHRTGRPS